MSKRSIIAVMALGAAAAMSMVEGAEVARWSGAGPYACNSTAEAACPRDWALSQLPPAVAAQVRAAIAERPEPLYAPILPGDVISHMAYYKDGEPRMDTRGTIVDRDDPATAWGWVVNGYSFVRIDECANWALVKDGIAYPTAEYPAVAVPAAPAPVIYGGTPRPSSTPIFGSTGTAPPWGYDYPGVNCCVSSRPDPGPNPDPTPPENTTPPVVPLPASGWALLIALVGMAALKKRAGK